MKSGTSFFDKNLYRSTLRRFWPVGAAFAAANTYRVLMHMGNIRYWQNFTENVVLLPEALSSLLPMAGGAVMAMAVYSWLFRARSTAFVTSLPVRRETVFLSGMAGGFTLLTAGCLLAAVLSLLLGAAYGSLVIPVALWLAVTELLCIAYFGFASFCAVLTGSIVILPAVYLVLLYAAVALEATLRRLTQFMIFGLSGQKWKLTALSPVYYLRVWGSNLIQPVAENGHLEKMVFAGWALLAAYAGAGLVFAALAVGILRRRNMESAGDVVAVPVLRKVFRWCAALAGSLSAGMLTLHAVFGYGGYNSPGASMGKVLLLLAMMLLGGFVGWFGAQGLVKKSARVFREGWTGFGVFCAIVTALVLCCGLDVMGIEKKQPRMEDVAEARLTCYYANIYPTSLREPENIAAAMELQRNIVANKKAFEQGDNGLPYDGGELRIEYYDAAGELLLARSYSAPAGEYSWASQGSSAISDAWGSKNPVLSQLQDVINVPEAVEARVRPGAVPVTAANVNYSYASLLEHYRSMQTLDLMPEDAVELYLHCVLPDSRDTSLGQLQLLPNEDPDAWGTFLEISFNFIEYTEYGKEPRWDNVHVIVPEDAARTRQWLWEHGMAVPGMPEPPIPGETDPEPDPADAVSDDARALAGLLETIYAEYDPSAAGTVVACRWARSLLEWYTAAGEDPALGREGAALFARVNDAGSERFTSSLARLRSAGEQLSSGELGLVRDSGRGAASWSAETVSALFDAIADGAGLDM